MATTSVLDAEVLLELTQSLTSLQRQIVTSLRDRGPGMLLEVAVRVLKFPEEVNQPVADLREKRLVTTSEFSGGILGNEIISLTRQGEKVADLLRNETFIQQLARGDIRSKSIDPGQQEVALLQKLGDLAERNGDLDAATTYYRQALTATQKLAAVSD